jgi:uncharacterized membrane protein YedE/YeeE
MSLPITGTASLILAVVFGAIFGILLHRGGVTNYNVIVNQFRFRDFTVLKIMLTAIVVGGIGVLILHGISSAEGKPLVNYHIKNAQMLGVLIGSGIFGIGMVLYGYCPGTGVAAIGTGSIHALVGALGMIAGGILYALSFEWVQKTILSVADLGKKRLPDLVGIGDWGWFAVLIVVAGTVFGWLYRIEHRSASAG